MLDTQINIDAMRRNFTKCLHLTPWAIALAFTAIGLSNCSRPSPAAMPPNPADSISRSHGSPDHPNSSPGGMPSGLPADRQQATDSTRLLTRLQFHPRKTTLTYAMQEAIFQNFNDSLSLDMFVALSQVNAYLEVEAVVSPEEGKQAKAYALRRAKAVRSFYLANWDALRNAERISPNAITARALPQDSVRRMRGHAEPRSVDVRYVGLPPDDGQGH